MKFLLNNIGFFKPKLSREEFDAYFNRLPDEIGVEWFRDGKFIIGNINIEGGTFMTQAISADEFVDMVNDALLAIYEIPKEYFDALLAVKKFKPSREEFQALNNVAVKKSKASVSFKKEELATANA